ncbi:MAG: hypothetical protein J6D20_08165 [Clostridia bacterium]|nr:hypothetical protein [Clostridia bacterium]
MKKILSFIITAVLIAAAVFALGACKLGEGDNNDDLSPSVGMSIADISSSELEIGGKRYNRFTFTFTDGSKKVFDVEIHKGADGSAGEDGENGKDGVTPEFKLENNVLYVSYDNGGSWEKLGDIGEEAPPATGGDDMSEIDKFEDYTVTASITNGYNGTNGIVVLITDNDGGDFETITRIDEMYRKYGLVGGLGTVAQNLYYDAERTLPKTADISKWNEFLDTGRWKIVNHSMTHKKYASGSGSDFAIDEDRLYEEIVESGDVLRRLFPNQKVLTYAMTGNPSSVGVEDWSLREAERKLIEEYYIGGRFGTDGNPVAFDKADYSSLPYATLSTASLNEMITKVNKCADEGKFYIVFNHYVIEKEALAVLGEASWTSIETMDALCAAVASRQNDGSLWCAHFEDAVMYMRERESASLSVTLVDGALKIVLTDEMDNDIYSHDLTVKVNLPNGTEAVKLVQGERVTYVKAVTDSNGAYALLNIKPDGGEAFAYPAKSTDVPSGESTSAKTPSIFAEELDEVLTFEDGSNTLAESGRLTLSPVEVTAKVVDKNGDKVVCIDKPITTADYSRMTFPVTVKNTEANAAVFEANLFIEHTSGNSIVQVLLLKDSAISMCRTYFTVELATKQLVFNTFNSLGESESAKTTAKAGEWFNLRIEYYEGTADTVRIKTYVNNILVSVSDKYYHANTDYVVPADNTELCVVAPHYNFVGKVYVDDISYKQVVKEYKDETVPEIDTSTPTEHNFDFLSVHMGESIKYSAKYPDSATITQETDGENNYLYFTKVRTDEQPYLEFLNTVNADECNSYVFKTKMKIDYTSGSKQVYLVLMCGSVNNYAYNCYFNITDNGELTFIDFNQGNSITSSANATTAKEGEWFDLRIEFYEGTRETLKIKTYVNEDLVYESTNYYPAYKDGETIIDADSLTSVRVMPAWGYVGSVGFDDLSVKQTNK